MDLQLLYQDDSLIICEKPVGISSESPGIPDLLREQLGYYVFPVHRLDKTTGGVCVLARTNAACTKMQRLLQQGTVNKEYLAVISGVPETDSGTFIDFLYHDQKTNKTFVVKKPRRGVREAICEWTVLESIKLPEYIITLVRIRLHSGRTHQIRIQFASRKMSLVGDRRYGNRINASAPALWSSRICFPHPLSENKTIEAVSLPPDEFPWFCFHRSNTALRHQL